MVRDADGNLTSDNFDSIYGFSFDENGVAVADMDDATFTVGYTEDGTMRAYVFSDDNLDKVYNTVLYARYNNRYYAFNITIGDEDAVAIKTVDTENVKSQRIYDLSGREVTAPSKGIYIRNGKKFIVK